MEDGEVRDTKNLADILSESLESHNVKTRRVYYVAGSSRIASRRIQIPMVKKNKIQEILEENGSEYFPVDISKYVLSYTIMGELRESADGTVMAAPQYDLMAYAAPKTISIACQEMSDNAGLTMIGIGYVGDSIYQRNVWTGPAPDGEDRDGAYDYQYCQGWRSGFAAKCQLRCGCSH